MYRNQHNIAKASIVSIKLILEKVQKLETHICKAEFTDNFMLKIHEFILISFAYLMSKLHEGGGPCHRVIVLLVHCELSVLGSSLEIALDFILQLQDVSLSHSVLFRSIFIILLIAPMGTTYTLSEE